MPIREYKCENCKLIMERITMNEKDEKLVVVCGRCGLDAQKVNIPTSIALLRSEMDNAPIDHVIGKDASYRYAILDERQKVRDKVRIETGSVGLTQIAPDHYVPINNDKLAKRELVKEALPETTKIDSGEEASKQWLDSAKDKE